MLQWKSGLANSEQLLQPLSQVLAFLLKQLSIMGGKSEVQLSSAEELEDLEEGTKWSVLNIPKKNNNHKLYSNLYFKNLSFLHHKQTSLKIRHPASIAIARSSLSVRDVQMVPLGKTK